jgi:hypothetical protein
MMDSMDDKRRKLALRAMRVATLVAGFGVIVAVARGPVVTGTDAPPPSKSLDEMVAFMAEARSSGRTRTARKTRLVDARPAREGEVVVTIIEGEGKETQSRPARLGDYVVRNRCPETGNEVYLVSADKFAERYEPSGGPPGAGGWREFQPVAREVRFVFLRDDEAPFSFVAPWGELMVARPGDAIVQDPADEKDVYRVARPSFDCTYAVGP